MSHLTNENLLAKTKFLVQEERRITLELIEHLKEIDARMLYAEMAYESLFEFCVRHLGLSRGATYRRLAALRLIQDVPEVREQIQDGGLSLSSAARVYSVFQTERKLGKKRSPEEKKHVLDQIQGLSQRECELTLLEIAPEAAETPAEKMRYINSTKAEIKMIVSQETVAKADRLKDFFAHAMPYGNYGDLFERLINKELNAIEKKIGIKLVGAVDERAAPAAH